MILLCIGAVYCVDKNYVCVSKLSASTDQYPSLRIESFAIINLPGVSIYETKYTLWSYLSLVLQHLWQGLSIPLCHLSSERSL